MILYKNQGKIEAFREFLWIARKAKKVTDWERVKAAVFKSEMLFSFSIFIFFASPQIPRRCALSSVEVGLFYIFSL